MLLQNFALPFEENLNLDLWYRCSGEAKVIRDSLYIKACSEIKSDTYMNAFDIKAWLKYTSIKSVKFLVNIIGEGEFSIYVKQIHTKDRLIFKKNFKVANDLDEYTIESCLIELSLFEEGYLYFILDTHTDCMLNNTQIICDNILTKNIHLSIGICTYHREDELMNTVHKISKYINTSKERWLDVVIVDNGGTINQQFTEGITCVKNCNTGGSGGFTKAMEMVVQNQDYNPCTHMLLMDDDVFLHLESIIRLRALLCYLKPDFCNEIIAGRMFRMDNKCIQYTAVEKWNNGKVIHIGGGLDMSLSENIWNMNNNYGGEYGGWWFAVYPMSYIIKNRPMPFFLHGDDAEFGLRHGGEPVILNGIQVWHETYEYRQSALIAYYDVRNTLTVCKMYCKKTSVLLLLFKLMFNVGKNIVLGKKSHAKMQVYAIFDFFKGIEWLLHLDIEAHNRFLKSKIKVRY